MTPANKLIAVRATAALVAAGTVAIVIGTRGPAEVPSPLPGAARYRFDESSPEVRRMMLRAVEGLQTRQLS